MAVRGDAKKVAAKLKRLPDGTFAPAGRGQVLTPGMKVEVPHKEGGGTVPGVVKEGHRVALLAGPDKGTDIHVTPEAPSTKKQLGAIDTRVNTPDGDGMVVDSGGGGDSSTAPYVKVELDGGDTRTYDQSDLLDPEDPEGPAATPKAKTEKVTHGDGSTTIQSADPNPPSPGPTHPDFGKPAPPESPGVPGGGVHPDDPARTYAAFQQPDPNTNEVDGFKTGETVQYEGDNGMVSAKIAGFTSVGHALVERPQDEGGVMTMQTQHLTKAEPSPPQSLGVPGAGTSIKDLPLGTTVTLADGNQYIVHKPVGDPWMILKPVGGGKAKPMHKMAPAVTADTSTAYDGSGDTPDAVEPVSGYGKMSSDFGAISFSGGATANPKAHPDYVDYSAIGAKDGKMPGSVDDSPGRGPTGKLRNFKAMNKAKLLGVISDLVDHGGDPEALDAAKATAATKGFVKPDAASTPSVKAHLMTGAGPKSTPADVMKTPGAKEHVSGLAASLKDLGKPASKSKSKPAKKAKPAEKPPPATSSNELFSKLASSVDMAKKAKQEGKNPASAFAPQPMQGGQVAPGPSEKKQSTATNAALEAYQAAGGSDPMVIEMLKKAAKQAV